MLIKKKFYRQIIMPIIMTTNHTTVYYIKEMLLESVTSH